MKKGKKLARNSMNLLLKKNNKKKDNYGGWPLILIHFLIFNFIPNQFILSIPSEYCATLEDTLEFMPRVPT
jgi:hypothetical protein